MRSAAGAVRRWLRAAATRVVWATMALPVVMVVTACGGGKEDLAKQIEQMQAEIRELRAEALTAQDRLEAVEQQLASADRGGAAPADAVDGHAADRPALRVVRLVPDEQEAPAQPAAEPEPGGRPYQDGRRPVVRANRYGGKIEQGSKRRAPAGGRASRRSSSPSRAGSR